MYYIYDYDGDFYGKVDLFSWAKRMANYCDGYVCNYEGYVVYDYLDYIYN